VIGERGRVLLLDLHSVASHASRIHGELTEDIYLGDRDGTTCEPGIVDAVEAVYRDSGFRVVRNAPYKGGYTTHHYGGMDGVDALQIEMVQRVYMDETDPTRGIDAAARRRIAEIFRVLVDAVSR
jgi:N-formylglutamate amidohydrolase